jgi:hypothetical protein
MFAGIRHTVEVTAETLDEAAVLAVAVLKNDGWIEDSPGPATRLEVEVREPAVRHVVTLAQLQRWAAGAAASPAERLKRDRLRELLGGTPAKRP